MKKCTTIKCLMLAVACLTVSAMARAEVVVVAGASSSVGSLSREQVADIFLGKNMAATPVDQAESNPIREEFYSKVTGRSAAQVRSYWAKQAFTGKGTPPKEAQASNEVKKMLGGNPALIGYIEKSAVDSSVKVLLLVP